MLRKIIFGFVALMGLAVVVLAAGLTWAHVAVRRERAPLPTMAAVSTAPHGGDLPVHLSIINTASQPMARRGVLDPGHDPRPTEPYVMSHPSFVLEWTDGRILLVDTGMNRDGAIRFGGLIERFGGGQPIQALTSVAERLGAIRERVQGVVFTHLHTDHTGGIGDLCAGVHHGLRVFMTEAQMQRPNFTTRPGLALLRQAGCVQQEQLASGPLFALDGFPGVQVIAAGGHTPGSQIVIAHVAAPDGVHHYAFAGDIANNIDGITYNIPKPFLYSLLLVPEDTQRLDELRRFLRDLRDHAGFTVLVSHDQLQLERSGVPAWHP